MSEQEERYNQAARELARLRDKSQPAALAALKQMDPTIFEYLTALLFEERGYPASSSGKPGDEGVDVLLQDGDYVGVVQCKRYDGSVGQPTIRDLYGTMMHNDAEEAYLVTTGTVTRQAREWSAGKPIHLVDGAALAAWVTQTKPKESGFSLVPLFSKFFSLGWLRWPALAATILLFGWGIFYAVSQLSSRFSDEPVAQQQVEFVDDTTTEETQAEATNTEADVAADTPAPVTQVSTQAMTSTPTAQPATSAPPTTAPPTTVPPTTAPPTTVPPTEQPAIDPMAAPTTANAAAPLIEPTPTNTVVPPATVPPATVPPTAEEPTVKTCGIAAHSSLRAWYDSDRLGCATGEMNIVWAAWQPFERGTLFWRSDTDLAYAFVGAPQLQWFELRERWDGSSTAERGDPPSDSQANLQAPVRGFGYVWGVNDALFDAIGWATEGEKGICLAVQSFEEGTILQSSKAQSCTEDNLFNHAQAGNWIPFTTVAYANGGWE